MAHAMPSSSLGMFLPGRIANLRVLSQLQMKEGKLLMAWLGAVVHMDNPRNDDGRWESLTMHDPMPLSY